MCIKVIISEEIEIETPREFLEHFKFLPDVSPIIHIDACLCDYDIEFILNKNNIKFKKEFGDFYIDSEIPNL